LLSFVYGILPVPLQIEQVTFLLCLPSSFWCLAWSCVIAASVFSARYSTMSLGDQSRASQMPVILAADATSDLPGDYDRIVPMVSLPAIPASWLTALRPHWQVADRLLGEVDRLIWRNIAARNGGGQLASFFIAEPFRLVGATSVGEQPGVFRNKLPGYPSLWLAHLVPFQCKIMSL
jgi:hypothetical protein